MKLFDKYDHDKNGVLSKIEVGEIMKVIKHGHSPTAAEVDECFRNMDINANGVVEKDEFLRVLIDWLQVWYCGATINKYLIEQNICIRNSNHFLLVAKKDF